MSSDAGILIVSYGKDIPWLEHCLNSVRKFASGFGETTLLVPRSEAPMFMRFPKSHGVRVMWYDRTTNAKLWHLDHQRMKCRADEVCPAAQMILHVDSDCVFTEPVTPQDYLHDGKPVLLVQPYSTMGKDVPPWQRCTAAAIGWEVTHETMRRHPALHHKGIYGDLRRRIEAVHGCSFDRYVLGCAPTFPWGFSEFNAIGQIALSEQWRERYHFIDTSKEDPPHSKLRQFWSHGGFRYKERNPDGSMETAEDVFKRLGI